jgi:hypothetical protein
MEEMNNEEKENCGGEMQNKETMERSVMGRENI